MGSPSARPASRTWEGHLWDFPGSVGLLGKEVKAPVEPHDLDIEALRERPRRTPQACRAIHGEGLLGWTVRADTTRWRMTVPGHSVSDSQTVF